MRTKTIQDHFLFFIKWSFICLFTGVFSGSASALFLVLLQKAGNLRELNPWLILLLPAGGLLSGLLYHFAGKTSGEGNNLLISESHKARRAVPFRMAPLVMTGTLLTHLFGGSAGREGTAVQMGGAIAERIGRMFMLRGTERQSVLVAGISGGFASVFGTPFAGAVFALEVLMAGRKRWYSLAAAAPVAFIADFSCRAWQVTHTHYPIPPIPAFSPLTALYCLGAGILFGLGAWLFSQSIHTMSALFSRFISVPWLRPALGGLLLCLTLPFFHMRYAGLGLPVISEAFHSHALPYDFLLKIFFTALTIGAGFKGGEVTPLFFTGATLGSALALIIPLPLALLAAMGFTAVFAGASNTPLACIIMGIELFGTESTPYLCIAYISAYLCSGHKGIYSAQNSGPARHILFGRFKIHNISRN